MFQENHLILFTTVEAGKETLWWDFSLLYVKLVSIFQLRYRTKMEPNFLRGIVYNLFLRWTIYSSARAIQLIIWKKKSFFLPPVRLVFALCAAYSCLVMSHERIVVFLREKKWREEEMNLRFEASLECVWVHTESILSPLTRVVFSSASSWELNDLEREI